MNVLDRDDHWPIAITDRGKDQPEQFLAGRACTACREQLSAEFLGDIEQRAERSWREQSVTCAMEPTCPRRRRFEVLKQGGLAHPRFAGNEHNTPVTSGH